MARVSRQLIVAGIAPLDCGTGILPLDCGTGILPVLLSAVTNSNLGIFGKSFPRAIGSKLFQPQQLYNKSRHCRLFEPKKILNYKGKKRK
jgi:hypothetical protein